MALYKATSKTISSCCSYIMTSWKTTERAMSLKLQSTKSEKKNKAADAELKNEPFLL